MILGKSVFPTESKATSTLGIREQELLLAFCMVAHRGLWLRIGYG